MSFGALPVTCLFCDSQSAQLSLKTSTLWEYSRKIICRCIQNETATMFLPPPKRTISMHLCKRTLVSPPFSRPMFLRQLSSFRPPFRPPFPPRPALRRAGFRSSGPPSSHVPHFIPAPRPCWPTRGIAPPPPGPPRFHLADQRVSSSWMLAPRCIDPGDFGRSYRSFSSTVGMTMLHAHRDRESPHKRRRCAEENNRGGGAGGGTTSQAKDEGSEREHRPKPCLRDGGRGKSPNKQKMEDAKKTKSKKHRQRDKTQDRRGDKRPAGGQKESQPTRSGQQQDVKSLQRHWEDSPGRTGDPRPPGGGAAFDFSVMSYNILSQQLLQDNVYLYQHCPPGLLTWDQRLPNLLGEMRQHDADILCLQEVQEDHYERQIKPALQALGYQCEYKKRTGNKPDGCAVIFKTSRLSLLSSNPVEFLRPGDALLDRDNVGLVLLLRPTGAEQRGADPSAFLCVANTHLLYNPNRGDIKLAQLAILLAEIGRLSRLPDGSANPVVLCGDFNSTPRSPLYGFLTTGRLDYRGLQSSMVSGQKDTPTGQRVLQSPLWSHSLGINRQCRYEDVPGAESSSVSATVGGVLSDVSVQDLASEAAAVDRRGASIEHGLKLQSSYQHRLAPDGRSEITTFHSRTASTVDYILYTPESSASGRGLELLGRLSLVGTPEVVEVTGLPNRCHSSDHLPLLARFRFWC
ncbi:protein angel homolog 2 isoform 2-T2 [Spinachia spinachia]